MPRELEDEFRKTCLDEIAPVEAIEAMLYWGDFVENAGTHFPPKSLPMRPLFD